MQPSRKLKWRKPLRLRGERIHEIFTNRDRLPVGLAMAEIREAPLHYHRKTHEWYVILAGTGRMRLGNRRIILRRGLVVYIKPGTKHQPVSKARNPLQILAITSPPWRASDYHEVKETLRRLRNR